MTEYKESYNLFYSFLKKTTKTNCFNVFYSNFTPLFK